MAAGDIGMKVIRATAGLVSELDPKKALLKGLMVPRYDVVDSVIARDAQPYKK